MYYQITREEMAPMLLKYHKKLGMNQDEYSLFYERLLTYSPILM